MAILKQGQLNQVLAVMVDKTDFATIESGITSNFTCKLFTVKHGGSAAASTITLSRIPSVVNSGIVRVTLKAADTSGVDHAILQIAHASCATQNIGLWFDSQDASNMLSGMSNILSQVLGDVTGLNGADKSDIASAVWGEKWDVHSLASTFGSAFEVIKDWGVSQIVSALNADIESYLSDYISGLHSILTSNVSDIKSLLDSRVVSLLATPSKITSIVGTTGVKVTSDAMSDIAVEVWGIDPSTVSGASTIGSLMVKFQNSAVAATIDASDMSDIASRVWAMDPSAVSAAGTMGSLLTHELDGASAAVVGVSNVVSALTGDVESYLSDYLSNIHSALASTLSDIDSQTTANGSQLALVKSVSSDAHSAAIKCQSYLSGMSNILSAVYVDTADISNVLSNTHADLANLSNIASQILGDTVDISNVLSNTHADLAGLSNIASQILDDTDHLATALVNKMVITESTGNAALYNDADSTIGSVAAAFNSDGTDTTRKRLVI